MIQFRHWNKSTINKGEKRMNRERGKAQALDCNEGIS